ncbi:MAG: regulator [Gammaproteobacteria bacterium]|nr:regulator [Gammaproteobacteria bacterium]
MRFGYKGLALLIVVIGAAIAGGYSLGLKRSGQTAAPSGAATTTGAGVVSPSSQLPANHPALDDAAPLAGAPVDNRFTHFRVGSRNVKSLYLEDRYAWIGTSGGVIRYDLTTDQHQIFDNKIPGLLSNGVFHVSRLGDRIAVGTYGGGLSLYDPAKGSWKNYNIPQGLADQFVYDVVQASNGDVWIATWSGANRVRQGRFDDPKQWSTFTVENTDGGLPNRWVYSIAEGPDGAMWFATEEGLARYRDGQWRNWKHSDGLGAPYQQVKDSIKFTNDPGRASQHHARNKAEQGLQDVNVAYNPNYIISLAVDRQGVVWCGTWGGGLARFDGNSWRNYTTKDGLPANHIFMLHQDRGGRLWIGTNQGLASFNRAGSGFDVLTSRDGLFADNVFSMADAADGTMWLGSFGGVARIVRTGQ